MNEQIKLWDSNTSLNFYDLMLHRIHEVLLVTSPYDAFILEEDGQLSEQILHEYLGMDLRYAPRIWQASSAREAMKMLAKRKINLVITMARVSDIHVISFGHQIKEQYPDMPVVLLAYDTSELQHLPDPIGTGAIDQVFIWTGNANVLTAIIKYIEDHRNVERDIKKANIRSIIVVEDDPYYYSVILPLLYSEIFYHTRNLLDKSMNATHRLLRMRARPKILLATTYEEAEDYFHRFQNNVMGIISDTRFPRNGELDTDAGLDFIRWVRSIESQLPIMLQSTNEENREKAHKANVAFLHKESKTLLQDLRNFILKNFGFGDFVFRTPAGEELIRVSNLIEFQEALKTVPDDSILFHAGSNHFSNWLAARGELELAAKIKPLRISDFDSVQERREYLVEAIEHTRVAQQKTRIIEYSYDPQATFTSIRGGSLGGKARGLAFAYKTLDKSDIQKKYPEVTIRIPKTAVIGTEEFERFMERNGLWETALTATSDFGVKQLFLRSKLTTKLVKVVKKFLEKNTYPLAIRSSGLMEDSQYQSLAGMYSTFVLPNDNPDLNVRIRQLCNAIKLVYASMFFDAPKTYLESSIHRPDEEKMAVIIQELVGQQFSENRFYPTFSGVAQSINFYPVSYMKRDEGIAYIALGLGKTVVDGEQALRFSPRYPTILPQFYSTRAMLQNSQKDYYALVFDSNDTYFKAGEDAYLKKFSLKEAEEDGSLKWIGSVLSRNDNILRDSLNYEGPRVVTFSNILKWNKLPLADILVDLLEMGEQAMGTHVELEFAGNIFPDSSKPPEFCLLQIRPMAVHRYHFKRDYDVPEQDQIFCKSSRALGDGIIQNIRHIVYVKPDDFDVSKTTEIADAIGRINSQIPGEEPYLLIGPGRWGSADPWLGIPVEWDQISKTRVIVEYNLPDFNVDPSFGGHFFQNITSLRIGYLTVNYKSNEDYIGWEWLNSLAVLEETKHLKWVTLYEPMIVQIDSSQGEAMCIKPQVEQPEIMNEEESTGI